MMDFPEFVILVKIHLYKLWIVYLQ